MALVYKPLTPADVHQMCLANCRRDLAALERSQLAHRAALRKLGPRIGALKRRLARLEATPPENAPTSVEERRAIERHATPPSPA